MTAMEEIFKLKKDFIALHAEYKSLAADETNPSVGTPPTEESQNHEEATRKKLSSLVDQMVNVMLRVVVISSNEILRQSREIESLQQDPSCSFNAENVDQTASDEEEDEEEIEEEEEQEAERSIDSSAERTAKDSIESLLTPEVCLNVGSSTCSKYGTLSKSRTDCKSLAGNQDVSKPNQVQQPKLPQIKPKIIVIQLQNQPQRGNVTQQRKPEAYDDRDRFRDKTEYWMDINRPAPPPPGGKHTLFKLTTEQKREGYAFYLKYKDQFMRKLIIERLAEKYYLPPSRVNHLVRAGQGGKTFKAASGWARSKLLKDPEKVKELIDYCKANPLSFSCIQLAKKYDTSRTTLMETLKKHGIKIYTSAEKRALKLNIEGKEYKPYHENPDVSKYHRLQLKERMKRRQEGDMRDGRSARHKDPTWKSLREKAGVPEGTVLYSKKYLKEWSERSRPDPEERQVALTKRVRKTTQDAQPASKTTSAGSMTRAKRKLAKKSTQEADQTDDDVDQSNQSATSELDTTSSNQTPTVVVSNHPSGHPSSSWSVPAGYVPYMDGGSHTYPSRTALRNPTPGQCLQPDLRANDFTTHYFQSFAANQPAFDYNQHRF